MKRLFAIGLCVFGLGVGEVRTAEAAMVSHSVLAAQVESALAQSTLRPEEKIQHALNRLGYGANPGVYGIGVKTFLRYRSGSMGEQIVDSAATDKALASWVAFNVLRATQTEPHADQQIAAFEVEFQSPLGPIKMRPGISEAEQLHYYFSLLEYRAQPDLDADLKYEASLALNRVGTYGAIFDTERVMARALLARYPLGEALENFWFNHFNINSQNVQGHVQQLKQYREGIRFFMGSDFQHMLSFTAHHPAMLIYLDNYRNFRPINATRGINENYARELIELHTLGEGPNLGNYVQADVFQAARILTGITVAGQRRDYGGTYSYFCPTCHDPGSKTVMGNAFVEGQSGQAAFLNFLARHPRTARNIARKLVNRFVMEQSSEPSVESQRVALENRLAATFTAKNGNLHQLYVALFAAPEFWGRSAYQAKVKQPFEWVASAYRAAGIGGDATPLTKSLVDLALAHSSRMGQPVQQYSFPTGYKDANGIWANTNSVNLAITQGFRVADFNLGSFRSKAGTMLTLNALENYFLVQNQVRSGSCFQNDYGRHADPYCPPGFTQGPFCISLYLPFERIVENARLAVAEDVFDFEGIYPTSYLTQAFLQKAMREKNDRWGGQQRPVHTQLGLLLGNPRFLRR